MTLRFIPGIFTLTASIVLFTFALWIVVPAPVAALLPLAVGAPEISVWIVVVAALLGAASLFDAHNRRLRRIALGLACERTGERARAIGHLKLALAMRPGNDDYERALRRLAG